MEKLHFLIVDDSHRERKFIINFLKQIGFELFTEASDGRDALEKLNKDETINFVITDWNMPDISGSEMVTTIRKDQKLKQIPILMVCVRGMKDDITEAITNGVDDCIVRPFSFECLKEKINKIIINLEVKNEKT